MWYECNNDWHVFGMHGFWWLFWVILVLILLFLIFRPNNIIGRKGKDSSLEILRRKKKIIGGVTLCFEFSKNWGLIKIMIQ